MIYLSKDGLKSGPLTFFTRFNEWLEKNNLNNDLSDNINLINSSQSSTTFRSRFPQVVRLDGRFNIDFVPYLPKSLSHPINNFGNAYVNRKLNKNINSDLTTGLIFQSEFCRRFCLAGLDIPQSLLNNSVTIFNGIDLSFYSSRKQLCDGKSFKAVSCHYHKPKKRTHLLPLIIHDLNTKHNLDIHLVIVGAFWPGYESIVIDNIKKYAPNNISLANNISQAKMPSFLDQFDFSINLGYEEPCSNSVIELIAKTIPVIHTNFGGNPELINYPPAAVDEVNPFYDAQFVHHFHPKRMYGFDANLYSAAVLNMLDNYSEHKEFLQYRRSVFSDDLIFLKYYRYIISSLEH